MHNLDNDGFAVLTYKVVEGKALPVLLFSGSYRKCVDFLKTVKTIVFNNGLVFCSAAEAKETLDSVEGIIWISDISESIAEAKETLDSDSVEGGEK